MRESYASGYLTAAKQNTIVNLNDLLIHTESDR